MTAAYILVKRSKSCGCVCLFYFLLLCMYCLFLSFVCFSGLFAMLPKKENNKTKAIFVCGLIFSLSVCPSQITDFWISRPSKLP